MKPSGIDVIGDIPAPWEVKPLRLIGRILKGVGGSKEDAVEQGIPCVRYGDLYTTHGEVIEESRTYLTEERAVAYTPIRYGDLLFAASGEKLEEIGKSAVNLIHGEARCGGDMIVLRPSVPVVPRFLGYATNAAPSVAQKTTMGRGTTVKHIYPAELRNLAIPIPPIDQQALIADFLARRTAAIDTLIEKQEQLLALLAEKRQALITQAVTKGLDPNAPMKDSGVVTLGRIPAHWHLTKLRRVGRVGQGDAFPHDLQGQGEGELPWFKVADMNRAGNEIEMLSADNYVSREVALAAKVTIFEPGAVIFPRVGAALLTNKRRLLTRPSIIDDNTYAVVPNNRIRSRFLYLSLLLVDMGSICSAGLVPTVTFSAIRDLDIALPPIAEQDAIIQHVEVECRRIDSLSQRVQAMIEKLREYRQALITAAVTGQLDVTSGAVATSAPKPYAEAVGT